MLNPIDAPVRRKTRRGPIGRGRGHRPAAGLRRERTHDAPTWREELKQSICTVDQLKEYVPVPPEEEKVLGKLLERHPMRIPRYYASLINWDDPADPLRRMAVVSTDELSQAGSYDTSGERANTKMPGLQHKYAQTALILSTNRCALYCRHCFRKRLVGLKTREILSRFGDAVEYIRQHKEINNVLISGGDPLILSTKVLREFLRMLYPIEHVRFIRFGSRTPVVFPQRILADRSLRRLFRSYSSKHKRLFLVTQFNHPRELTEDAATAVDAFMNCGMAVSNQSVLMRGVNDDPKVLAALLNNLVGIGVNPYYVFQCRPVKRVQHGFQVPLRRGVDIIEKTRRKLNGHSKRFRYAMSHRTGKVEIVGIMGDEIYFKYHQAKSPRNANKFFKRKLKPRAGWLDELKE